MNVFLIENYVGVVASRCTKCFYDENSIVLMRNKISFGVYLSISHEISQTNAFDQVSKFLYERVEQKLNKNK